MPIKLYKNRHRAIGDQSKSPVRLKTESIFISFLIQNTDSKYIIAIITFEKRIKRNKLGKHVVVTLGWL